MAQLLVQNATPNRVLEDIPDPGWRNQRPFLIAAALYLATTLAILIAAWHLAGGHFIYPLDDVYINMAVAKNFALHTVWGVTPYEFSSSTSSPLYVLLLSGVYRLLGPSQYAPLALSWIFGLAALSIAAKTLKQAVSPARQTVALIAFVLLTPLFVVGTLGMEHSLHLLLVLLFLDCFENQTKPLWLVVVITALMVGTRYEGLLMAGVACLILLVHRRWLRALVIAASAWIPVGVYALFSRAHGGYWLPNSVAIKGLRVTGLSAAERLSNVWAVAKPNLIRGPHLAFLAVLLLLMAAALRKPRPRLAATLAVVGGTSLLHLLTADVGWAFRYEAYLVGAGLVAAACAWPALRDSRPKFVPIATIVLSLTIAVLVLRCALAGAMLPKFSRNIYLQQWQTARFLQASYPGGAVAANDIGAIDYQTDLHCLDLAGLASADVFNAKRSGDYTTDFLEDLADARGIQVAVLYDSWFSAHPITSLGGPPVPDSWIRVRRWRVPEKLQLGDTTISFYALSPEQAATLKTKLDAFEPTLPKEITVMR
jgi:hypothetical protein